MSSSFSPPSMPFPLRAQVTTTTLFAGPTFLGSQSTPKTPLPIPAIVGGSCAGVFLAILAVIGWKWWGIQIQRDHAKELEKRRAARAAVAYKRFVIDGKKLSPSTPDPRRSRPPSTTRRQSDRKVKFAAAPEPMPCVPDVPSVGAISAPRALRRTANKEEPSPPRRIRASLTDGRARTPLHPNLLNTSSPRKFREIGATADSEMVDSRSPLREGAMAVLDDKVSGGNTRIHLPRIQASLSSLLDEAHRQSKSSQNSGSERSRHSVAEYCPTRRWSWRALINGPGFSFGQNGIGTGKNRLSADTSSMNHWPEENPSVSIGYAYSGIDEESRGNGSQTEAPEVDVSLLYPQDYFSYCEEDADAGQHGEPLEEPEEIR